MDFSESLHDYLFFVVFSFNPANVKTIGEFYKKNTTYFKYIFM